MLVLYNILQLMLLVVFFPAIVLFVLLSPKYRDRVPARLGFGLSKTILAAGPSTKTIWLHALSVGEVTSALPLLTGLRQEFPDSRIVVSVSTRTGKKLAMDILKDTADHIIDGPLDLLPVVYHFSQCIRPHLYIQVETDFWPNILKLLSVKRIPSLLVNGRISQKSMGKYLKFRHFFQPMFECFSYLCLQTEGDKKNMSSLGVTPQKLMILGNLKFDAVVVTSAEKTGPLTHLVPENKIIFTAGSTHEGEEEILLKAFKNARKRYPQLFLILVPRSTARAQEIIAITHDLNMGISLRSENKTVSDEILLVDTIGELTLFYSLSDIAFVGGSLVMAGGHNPIEPAALQLPVLFGPHMQDFTEIAEDLIAENGATQVSSQDELETVLVRLISSEEERKTRGKAAAQCVQRQQGVVRRHLDLIRNLL